MNDVLTRDKLLSAMNADGRRFENAFADAWDFMATSAVQLGRAGVIPVKDVDETLEAVRKRGRRSGILGLFDISF